ncbi:beta-glucosidase family protein [Aquimarina litoralis]|uniref:beta-glucosidase family protein n=1 Tax=Aquimarina litoralis TaxID=584605 RepID=UPI001C57ACF2|nr:glycoside hydrolase family 3 C-terminal domain-containing protein [Aquimarina litoralis]MBW1297773.1 glycosyl hydrolase [Aquimarina litoralis]
MAISKSKKRIKKVLKVIGVLFLLGCIVGGYLYYKNVNYDMYSLYITNPDLKNKLSSSNSKEIAKELVSEMTLEEKIDQMYGEPYGSGLTKFVVNFLGQKRFPHVYVGKNDRLGIPPWVLSDGPRGARVLDKNVDAVTTFPVGMARGATWNPELEYEVNKVISSEMRANRVNYAATPCINLLRHPGWGRAQETYGEDPWLMGAFGVAAVKGLEENNVMACPKHFVLNSIDNSRWVVDVKIDERSLREVYLPHWKKIIQEGKPASIMSAYNSVNGDFCAENKHLLTDILKDEWGFEGFVTTDWIFGLYDGVKGIQAGLHVEMPFQQAYTNDIIETAITDGKITETQIDQLVIESLATRLPYALTDDQDAYPHSIIGKESSIDLARTVAEESMVLLKNEKILPFTKDTGKTIAVIGRIADVENTGDQGSSDSNPIYVETPYEGIKKFQESLGNKVIFNDGSDLESVKQIASKANEVILIVGFTYEDEGEYIIFSREKMLEAAENGKPSDNTSIGGDREDLRLLESDETLIQTIASINKQLAVVYVGGSAIDISSWEEQVPAILFSWYSGMEGGTALANILYGDVSPSGKLPFSIAKDTKDYPLFTPYTAEITYNYYHGYTLFDKRNIKASYPFGYGLSYSKFKYDSLQVKQSSLSINDTLKITVQIKNEGNIKAKDVAQMYIGFKNSKIDRPVKLLRDFQKATLSPNTIKTVALQVPIQDLAWYNPQTKSWEIEYMEYEVYVGNSSKAEDLLTTTFQIE